jgi:hypothetical protein
MRKDIYKDAKPFKKGNDPRRNVTGLNRKDSFDVLIEKDLTEDEIKRIFKAHKDKALSGDMNAIKEFYERAYGKMKEKHEVEVKTVSDIDISKLSDEELRELDKLQTKARISPKEPT